MELRALTVSLFVLLSALCVCGDRDNFDASVSINLHFISHSILLIMVCMCARARVCVCAFFNMLFTNRYSDSDFLFTKFYNKESVSKEVSIQT